MSKATKILKRRRLPKAMKWLQKIWEDAQPDTIEVKEKRLARNFGLTVAELEKEYQKQDIAHLDDMVGVHYGTGRYRNDEPRNDYPQKGIHY